jgi:hypothetical protein
MYYISSCNLIYFLKFVIHKINFKIVKSVMMVLTERENTDVTLDWMMQVDANYSRALMIEMKRKS